MKKTIHSALALVAICCMVFLAQGCGKPADDGHAHGPDGTHPAHDAPAAQAGGDVHKPKYNEVMAEFPGHKYAMEIIDEKETTGLVTAFITDAHFEPTAVDAKELRLNFMVDGKPKTYTLTRTEQEAGKPVAFTLKDMELATLNCEGWKGEATVSVEIGGTPYNAKLVKLGSHDHGGDLGHAH